MTLTFEFNFDSVNMNQYVCIPQYIKVRDHLVQKLFPGYTSNDFSTGTTEVISMYHPLYPVHS